MQGSPVRAGGFFNLLYQTTRCSFLSQEKNSALGLLWHLINPLATTLVLYGVFSNMGRFGTIPHFALFILSGVIQFNFFAHATARAAEGMLGSRSLILSLPVPPEILVLRAVCLEGVTYVIELGLVAAGVVVVGQSLTWGALYYAFVIGGLFLLTFGCSLLLAGVVVFLTDVVYIWSVGTRLLFFLTPIFYAPQMLKHPLAARLIAANPLAQMVTLGRKCLLSNGVLALREIATLFVGPFATLVVGWTAFQLLKPRIADYI